VTPWALQYRGGARGVGMYDHGMHLLVALAAPGGGVCTSRFVSSLDFLCLAEPFALPCWISYIGRRLCTIICLDASP